MRYLILGFIALFVNIANASTPCPPKPAGMKHSVYTKIIKRLKCDN